MRKAKARFSTGVHQSEMPKEDVETDLEEEEESQESDSPLTEEEESQESDSPLTEEELVAHLEVVKQITEPYLDHLQSCDEYHSEEALDAIDDIGADFGLLESYNDYKTSDTFVGGLIDFFIERGLPKLIVKIIKSTSEGKVSHSFRKSVSSIFSHLGRMHLSNKWAYERFGVELIKHGIIRALVDKLGSCDPHTKEPHERVDINRVLFNLSNMRKVPNVIPIYRAANAVKTVMPFVTADNVMTQTYSLHRLAYIVNEKESKRLVAQEGCIATMMDMLNKTVHSDQQPRRYDFVIKMDDGTENTFYTRLRTQLEGINDLATNDVNKKAIVQQGGVTALSAILRPDSEDDEKEAATEALWKISFLENHLDIILTHLMYTDTGALEELKRMRSSTNPKLRDASQGVLHQLGLIDIHEELPVEAEAPPQQASPSPQPAAVRPREPSPSEPPPSYQETMDALHIMISYQWDHQDRAIKIKDKLTERGYNVWFDLEKMEGNILVAMANAVEKADAILLCFSQQYKASVCCQAEAEFAFKLHKPIIPVKIDETYEADGFLGLVTGMKKYIRAYSDDILEKDLPHLLRELGNKGRV